LASAKGILKVAREVDVSPGIVQRIRCEMQEHEEAA
jgi:hypothetical protein